MQYFIFLFHMPALYTLLYIPIYLNLLPKFHYNISRVSIDKENMKMRNSVRKTGKRPQINNKDDDQQEPKPQKHGSINHGEKSQEQKSQEIAFFNLIVGRRPEQQASQATSIFKKQSVCRYAEKNEQQKDVEIKNPFQQKATDDGQMVQTKVVKNDRIKVYTDLFNVNHQENSLVYAFKEASQKQQQHKQVESKPESQIVFSKKSLSVVHQRRSSEEDGMGSGPKIFYDLSGTYQNTNLFPSRIISATLNSVKKSEKKEPQQSLSYKFNATNQESLNTAAQKNQFNPYFVQQNSQKNLGNTSRSVNRPSTNVGRVLEQSCSSNSPNQSLFQSEKTQTPQLFPTFGLIQQKKSNHMSKPSGILSPNFQIGQGVSSKTDVPKQYEHQNKNMNPSKNPLLQSQNPSLPVFSSTAIASFVNTPGSIFGGGGKTTPDTPKFSTQLDKKIPEFQKSRIQKAFIQLYKISQKQRTQSQAIVQSSQMTFPSFIPIVNEPKYLVNVESQQRQQEMASYQEWVGGLNYVVNQVRSRYENDLKRECQRAKSQFKSMKTDLDIQKRIQDKMNELFWMLEQQARQKQNEIIRLQEQNNRLQQSLHLLIPKLNELKIQKEKKQKNKSPSILQQMQELQNLVKQIQATICTKPQFVQKREQELKTEPTEMTICINYIYEMIANAENVLFRLAKTHIL